MPFEYKPPTRLSALLRSSGLYWTAFGVVAAAIVVLVILAT